MTKKDDIIIAVGSTIMSSLIGVGVFLGVKNLEKKESEDNKFSTYTRFEKFKIFLGFNP